MINHPAILGVEVVDEFSHDLASDAVVVKIRTELDVLKVRHLARQRAAHIGLDNGDIARVATALSEVARNIVEHAGEGCVTLQFAQHQGRRGLRVVATDDGPGIADVIRATQLGRYSPREFSVGLPGAKYMMDDFEIVSIVGIGTTVTMTKWAKA